MGGVVAKKDPGPVILRYQSKHVSYHKKSGGIIVSYGEHVTPENCIKITGPGARVDLIGSKDNTICILNRGSSINCSGIIELGMGEAIIRLELDARIEVDVNARLIIYDTLLMEEGASLVLEPGAELQLVCPLHITKGATVRIAAGITFCHSVSTRVTVPLLTVAERHMPMGKYGARPVTWIDEDKSFLVDLIHFFCWRWRMHQDVILPWVLPLICQRYGVLMTPRPYYIVPKKSWQRPQIADGLLSLMQQQGPVVEKTKLN